MQLDTTQIRKHFSALALHDDGRRRIYLDNPAGTQVPESVIDAIGDCLRHANANLGGPFNSSIAADDIVKSAHLAMADLLNAPSPAEIVFGANMTSLTFQISRALGGQLNPGDEIIVSELDHDANVTPWALLARDLELVVKKIRLDTDSFTLDYEQFDDLLNDRTRLVCVGHASNLLGTINDIPRICTAAHKYGALVFVDGVHSVPHLSIDVQSLGCDFLVCSPYKFFGPHQGVLWGRKALLESLDAYKLVPAPDTLPGRFETGTQNHEAMAGVTAAVDYLASLAGESEPRRKRLEQALELIREYEHQLCRALIERLTVIEGLTVHGITAASELSHRAPTVSFTMRGVHPATIAKTLAQNNIFAWSGHSYAVEPCKALGLLDSGGVLRVGLVHYNTAEDVDALIDVLQQIAAEEQDRLSA
ncbi:MAG: cysteine desulfurase-like protein [Gammaproteobacteria bacterium]|nr:cysteine desulfurase-like protein [Gammaproteobacteria bacterium]